MAGIAELLESSGDLARAAAKQMEQRTALQIEQQKLNMMRAQVECAQALSKDPGLDPELKATVNECLTSFLKMK